MFDLDLLAEFCREQDLPFRRDSPHLGSVTLAQRLHLVFENLPDGDDTTIYFEECTGGWHSHGSLWADPEDLLPITILSDLLDGSYLVQQFSSGDVLDISLVPLSCAEGQTQLEPGEMVSYYRLPSPKSSP